VKVGRYVDGEVGGKARKTGWEKGVVNALSKTDPIYIANRENGEKVYKNRQN